MALESVLTRGVREAVSREFGVELETVELQPTRKEFEGDITVVVFPMLRQVKGNPAAIGEAIGAYLAENLEEVWSRT